MQTSTPVYFDQKDQGTKYKLIELSEELARSLKEGDKLILKGNATLPAVLCTDSQTFELKQVECSNMLLLVSTLLDKDSLSEGATIQATMKSHIELTQTTPEFGRLRDILKKHTIKTESQLESHGIALSKLSRQIQCSDRELVAALRVLEAMEHQDKWLLLHDALLGDVLDTLVTHIRSQGFAFGNFPARDIRTELLESFCGPIIDHVFHLYCEQTAESSVRVKQGAERFEDRQLEFRVEKYCLFLACRLLQKVEKYTVVEFQKKWREAMVDFEVNMDLIKGYGLVEKQSVSWFPAEALPREPEKRFAALFKKLPVWTLQQIVPYLEDLGQSKEQLLLKWSLCTPKKDDKGNEFKYYSEKK